MANRALLSCICAASCALAALSACAEPETGGDTCAVRIAARAPEPSPLAEPDLVYVTIRRNGQTVLGRELDLFGADESGGTLAIVRDDDPTVIAPADEFQVKLDAFRSTPFTGAILASGRTGTFSCPGDGAVDVPMYIGPAQGFAAAAATSPARSRATATALPDGRVLVVGGEDANGAPATPTAAIYDHRTGLFCSVTDGCLANDLPARVHHSATLLADGSVLVLGGQTPDAALAADAETVLADAHRFDPRTNSFEELHLSMPARASHLALALDRETIRADRRGKVYVIGGRDGDGARGDTLIVDVAAATTAPGPTLATARYHAAGVLLASKKILVSGGRDAGGALLDSTESIDVERDLVAMGSRAPCPSPGSTAMANLCARRAGHTATLLGDDSVLLWGGVTAPVTNGVNPPPVAEVWTLTSESSLPATQDVATLPRRAGHTATRLRCFEGPCPVLIAGGEDPSTGVAAQPVLFRQAASLPTSGAQSYGGSIVALGDPVGGRRAYHASAALADGAALLVGGSHPGSSALVIDAHAFTLCESPARSDGGSALSCPAP